MTSKKLLAAAALAGLLSSNVAFAEEAKDAGKEPADKSAATSAEKEKHACKGMNSCKGNGGDGKNDCKGKGSCATDGSKPAAK